MTRRSGRRRSLGGVAVVCAALVLTLAAPPANADDEDHLRRKARQLQAQIKAQAGDVGATTTAVIKAAAQLADARAQLPAARAAVVEAEAQLTAARVQDEAAAQALVVAQAEQEKATRAVAAVQQRIDDGYALVGQSPGPSTRKVARSPS